MSQEDVRKAVHLFLEAGYNVSPGLVEFLSEYEDPLKVSADLLEKIKKSGKELKVLTPEVFKEVLPSAEKDFGGLIVKEDWSFARVKTDLMTHGLHPYPARMIPQIAERLINRYSSPNALVLDPFCGSGTVLVESRRHQRSAVGNDINPLAVLLAKVKSKRIEPKRLHDAVTSFLKDVDKDFERKTNIEPMSFPNIEHWFKDFVIRDLSIIRYLIDDVKDIDIRDFLKVCFSITALETSNVDLRSSRFIRVLPKEKLERHKPKVLTHFRKKVLGSVRRVGLFYESSYDTLVDVIQGDAQKLPFSDGAIDLIVTSPPYGEERNTVAYTRWSKLSLYWLGFKQTRIKDLERGALGGIQSKSLETQSETANRILDDVARVDYKRAAESAPFFCDYQKSLKELHRVLKPGGHCCIVVGNRSIKRLPVPMNAVTIELGKTVGFGHEKTYYRDIPKKLIPWTTPTGETIFRENIIILSKD